MLTSNVMAYNTITLFEPQSRFGDQLTLIPSHLSPKRDCGSETGKFFYRKNIWCKIETDLDGSMFGTNNGTTNLIKMSRNLYH